jgi:hypothetical protein
MEMCTDVVRRRQLSSGLEQALLTDAAWRDEGLGGQAGVTAASTARQPR